MDDLRRAGNARGQQKLPFAKSRRINDEAKHPAKSIPGNKMVCPLSILYCR